MDLGLYMRVLWRFRVIVLFGLVLATALALLSFVRVSFEGGSPTVEHRQAEVWQSQERLLITQLGFAEGWTNPPSLVPGQSPASSASSQAFVHFGNLAGLAPYYAQLANSDQVQKFVYSDPSINGVLGVHQAVDPVSEDGLPILAFTGTATTPADAVRVARRGSAAFRAYLERQQDRTGIPSSNRVRLRMLNRANGAAIITPRKKTLPVMVFLTGLVATVGLAFALENLRPRLRLVEAARFPDRSDSANTG